MKSKSGTNIRILPAVDINRLQWDACVANDTKALIYSRSFYLDEMTAQWYGVVVNDYEAVLALPVKKIAGFKMIYSPPFFQRFDIAGRYDDTIKEMIGKEMVAFSKLISLHISNEDLFENIDMKTKPNFILKINRTHSAIANDYSKECRKNITKAINRGCVFERNVSIEQVVEFYQKAYGAKAAYKQKHFDTLISFVKNSANQQYFHLLGVTNEHSKELIYAALLLDDGRRIYYLLGAPSEEGRKARATAFFIDQVIATFAEKRVVFDFEGSGISDVAAFYKTFSPETEHYYRYYINRFPQPAKALLDKVLK